jgi:autotransporter-associated beta strand protein
VASGGTYKLGANDAVSSISGAGQINLDSYTLTAGNSNNQTFSGVLSGTGGLNKQGSGKLTLSGLNTYSGATFVNAGTLEVTQPSSTPTQLTCADGASSDRCISISPPTPTPTPEPTPEPEETPTPTPEPTPEPEETPTPTPNPELTSASIDQEIVLVDIQPLDNVVDLSNFEEATINDSNSDSFAASESIVDEQPGIEELSRIINQQVAAGSQVTLEGVDVSLGDSFVVAEQVDEVASSTISEDPSVSAISDNESSVQRDTSSSDASSENDDESVTPKSSEDNSSTSDDSTISTSDQKIMVFTIPQEQVESRLIDSDVISSQIAVKALKLSDLSNRKPLSIPLIQSTLRRMRGVVSGSL